MDAVNRQRLLVFFIPLFLSLPFINRAYFVDDSYFVDIARWLKDNPTQPYHFRADDAGEQTRGWEEDGFVRMVNPLGHHYYLALLIKLGGEKEWFLRLGCLLLSCFSAFFIFELARRFTDDPLLATALCLVTPAQWLTQHSLLIDATTGFGFLGALYFFIRGVETNSIPRLLVSGLFMAFAILTKYPAVLIVPLTASWVALRWKKITRPWIYLLPWAIALGGLAAYSLWTAQLYGSPHIIAASRRMVNVYGWAKVLVFMIFLSGVTLMPLVSWIGVRARTATLGLVLVGVGGFLLASPYGGFTVLQGLLIAMWAVTSMVMAAFVGQWRSHWTYPRDHFLILWVVEFVVMMFAVMGWVAGRYYVIVVPGVIFLMTRLVQMRWPEGARPLLKFSLAGMFVLAAALNYGDYRQADTARVLVKDLKQAGFNGGPGFYYTGDSFTVNYLKDEGWSPCFPSTQFKPGDKILVKFITRNSIYFASHPVELKSLAVFEYPTRFPFKLMDMQGSAGFYASVWGTLPFSVSGSPWERAELFEVTGLKSPR